MSQISGKLLSSALPTVAGVAAGFLASFLFRPPASRSEVVHETVRIVSSSPAQDVRPSLSSRVLAADAGGLDPVVGGAPSEFPLSPEAIVRQRQDAQDEHVEHVASHRASPVDRVWSRAAEQYMNEDLVDIGARSGGAVVQSVDCRSVSCEVVLSWADYDTAHVHLGDLVHQPFRLNCVRRITLPDDQLGHPDPTASLLIECAEAPNHGLPAQ